MSKLLGIETRQPAKRVRPFLCPLFRTALFLAWISWPWEAAAALTAPTEIIAEELGIADFRVVALFGDPVTSLTADLSSLPPGNTASFTTAPDNTSGTFHWSPESGAAGSYVVTFVSVTNGVSSTGYTRLSVISSGTTAVIRGGFHLDPTSVGPGTFDVQFHASDQGGTSTLATTLSVTDYDGCPDTKLPVQTPPRLSPRPYAAPGRYQLAPSRAASAPTMSIWGNPDGGYGYVNCAPYTIPIDLYVQACSTTPEANPSLTCEFAYGVSFGIDYMTRDPRVIAPTTAYGDVTVPLAISVDANDPDGDPIGSLTADLSDLPPGNDATFAESGDHAHGVLTWTPAVADSGNYLMTFRAANLFTSTAATLVHVRGLEPTGVGTAGSSLGFSAMARPNPLGEASRLQVVTTRSGPLRVQVFDVLGRLVKVLLAEPDASPGVRQIPLRMDGRGRPLRSGVYFYRVEAAEGLLTGRLAVLR